MTVVPSWIDCWRDGMSASQAAAARGVSVTAACQWSSRSGKVWAVSETRWSPEDTLQLVTMWRAKKSTREIARRLKRTTGAINSRIAQIGMSGDGQNDERRRLHQVESNRAVHRKTWRLKWAGRHGLTASDCARLFEMNRSNVSSAASRAGINLADGRGCKKGDAGYSRRLLRAIRTSMGAGGYIPPEVERLVPIVMDHVLSEDAA